MAHIELTDPKSGKVIDYYMNDRLKHNLEKKVKDQLTKKDKDFVMVVDGAEGCLSEDTLIKTSEGNEKIKDLFGKKPFYVETLNLKTKQKEIGKAICKKSGRKQLFEIETEDGRKINATSEHTFFVMRNKKIYEVKLSDLKEGDELICD